MSESSSPLHNRVALVTGASSGIGAATARALDAAGMKLVLTARREDRLNGLAAELSGPAVLAGDILDATMPDRLVARALEAFGRFDVLVNNAGIMTTGEVDDVDVDKTCLMIRVNVEAAVRMAYAAARHFKKQNAGQIVNVSSVLGIKTRPGAGPYAGTKHAIEAFSESLRMELARTGVKVMVIEPGLTETELFAERDVHPAKRLNIQKPLAPEDIARCIRFMLEQPPHVRIPQMLVIPTEHET